MGRKQFDRKFGVDAVEHAPQRPGVYLFRDAAGDVVYVGKTVNLRRRLTQYRNATRKKRDRKAAAIVRAATSLDWQITDGERDALLLENELIQRHRPAFNVAGAFWFTYPVIGMSQDERYLSLCSTSVPDELSQAWPAFEPRLFGAYRGRQAALDGFFAVTRLLARLGHRERRPVTDRKFRPVRYSKLVRIRRLPADIEPALIQFWSGQSPALLHTLALSLLELASARRDAAAVQRDLETARAFFDDEAAKLFDLRVRAGETRTFVPQHQRDRLQILATVIWNDRNHFNHSNQSSSKRRRARRQ